MRGRVSHYEQKNNKLLYSVTPKPDRLIFVNTERIYIKYPFQIPMVGFIKVAHPPRYSEM